MSQARSVSDAFRGNTRDLAMMMILTRGRGSAAFSVCT